MSALGQAFHALHVDVARPDAPRREIPGEHRLQNLDEFVRDVNILMDAAGCPLSHGFQKHCLREALEALLFGEQAS